MAALRVDCFDMLRRRVNIRDAYASQTRPTFQRWPTNKSTAAWPSVARSLGETVTQLVHRPAWRQRGGHELADSVGRQLTTVGPRQDSHPAAGIRAARSLRVSSLTGMTVAHGN